MSHTEVKVKQVGQNLMVVIGSEKYSKRIEDKDKREELKGMIKSYNEKPTKKLLKSIEKELKPEKTSRPDKAQVVKSNTVKPEVATKAVNETVKSTATMKAEEAKKKPVGYTSRRGEY